MSRRGSESSLSSSSEVNFDDLDDDQVFGFLEDDSQVSSPSIRTTGRSPSADFRLDFSSRVRARAPPPPIPTETPNKPVTRKSLATTKPRSPSLTTKKRSVQRQSMTVNTNIFSQTGENSLENVLPTPIDSENDLKPPVLPTMVDVSEERDNSSSTEQIVATSEVPSVRNSKTRKVKAAESIRGNRKGSGVIAPVGNANALVSALASLQDQVKLLTTEKTQLENEAITTRKTMQNLEQKLAASELSSDLFARQLENVKESFQAKLMAREEEISLEKMTFSKEKETQLQHQQTRFLTEADLWKHEIAALTKVKLELERDNDRLQNEVNDHVLELSGAQTKLRTLQLEHHRIQEELQILLQERQQFEHTQVELDELRIKMTEASQQYEAERQKMEERATSFVHEKEAQIAEWERERQLCVRQNEDEKVKLLRFVQEVRDLHHLLKISAVETRESLKNELKKTKETLEGIQQQVGEFAVHQSDREVALMSRKGRILQLETQLKNDRLTINQLETTLTKSTRVLEKKFTILKTKFQEQKEYLEITLAVRQGLTTDLQSKRKHVAELEREVARFVLTKGQTDVKLKHLQQQIVAMQKVHARESIKGLISSIGCSKVSTDVLEEENNEGRTLTTEEAEWHEFVELVAAYEAERQLQTYIAT